MDIHQFLRLPHRFRWGGVDGDDCTTWCATWAAHLAGIDPAEGLRGTYRDREGAYALLDAAGGLVPFMDGHLRRIGFVPTDNPKDGDIGAVMAPVGLDEEKLVGAIRFGPLWAVLSPAGVMAKALSFQKAWTLK